jgi:hypothetical protein
MDDDAGLPHGEPPGQPDQPDRAELSEPVTPTGPVTPTEFAAFDRLVDTCRRTRAVLVAVTHERAGDGEMVRHVVAHEALAHVDAVLDGLMYLARTGAFDSPELRSLVRRAGIVGPPARHSAEAVAAQLEAALERPALRRADVRAILAAEHARVVFSLIPRLPPEAVAWPRPHRTYADIAVPRSEGELLVRVDELARVLWRVAEGDDRRDEPLRRTLAFYEAGARLSMRGGFAAA